MRDQEARILRNDVLFHVALESAISAKARIPHRNGARKLMNSVAKVSQSVEELPIDASLLRHLLWSKPLSRISGLDFPVSAGLLRAIGIFERTVDHDFFNTQINTEFSSGNVLVSG
ncbi:MAG: hypothetical protein EA399_17095 [Desulfovibrionales bacterium]|nr:MAG: hypothetical protein EA399_17095 [Desulfovibrionales bacterium]